MKTDCSKEEGKYRQLFKVVDGSHKRGSEARRRRQFAIWAGALLASVVITGCRGRMTALHEPRAPPRTGGWMQGAVGSASCWGGGEDPDAWSLLAASVFQ